jgi:hypothetical protein
MKRSPMPARTTPMARGGRLSPMSSKRRAEAATRTAVREQALTLAGHRCTGQAAVPEVACGGPLDVDEIKGRGVNPGGHLDPSNVQVLCRAHHEWKHAHPDEARARGLRKRSTDA